jgi:carbon-monoxide dehydrogenase large subunit
MTLFGTPVPRTEDARFLAGRSQYVADVDLPGAAVVTYVTSTIAHARILSIDVEEARGAPGVLDVVTGADLDVGPYPNADPSFPEPMARPLLAQGVVRFVGEAVVAIVSETRAAGADAADLVVVDYDPLPPLVDNEASLAGELLLFPEAGTNVVLHAEGGSDEADVDACEVVVRATFHSARVAPCPIETRSAASRWEDDGRLTHWSSCQGAHPIRALLCKVHGLPESQVRVIAGPDVGGSFGAKGRAYPEEVLLPWLARRVGRAVRWTPTRSQDMVGLGHSRAQIQHVALGGRRDGTFEALDLHVVADSGAYPLGGPVLPRNTGQLAAGVYRTPAVRWRTDAVATTTTPTTAYRGAGRPEAAAFLERVVDLFAAEVGMDPAEVRRKNMIPPDAFPYTTPTGLHYDSGEYEKGLDTALEVAGYAELRAEQARRREAGDRRQLGIGIATFLDRTAGVAGTEYGACELRADGTVLVRTGSSPYGQGHHTSWAMLVADRTGLPMDRIEVIHGDTDLIPRGGVTGGSRSVQKAGSAVAIAAEELVVHARQVAADLLEASPDDVVLDVEGGGRFHVVGTPARALEWQEIADATAGDDGRDALACETDFAGTPTFPSGAYVAAVEVDTETGQVEVRHMVTVDDAGMILNPLLALGQIHGGAAQGVAQALLEVFSYDEDGNPLTGNFADYAVATAADLPAFDSHLVETPSPNNPLGAKGIAESGTIGAPPAVQNAVIDALRHLGVDHIDMPCTPERVWRAIQAAGGERQPAGAAAAG